MSEQLIRGGGRSKQHNGGTTIVLLPADLADGIVVDIAKVLHFAAEDEDLVAIRSKVGAEYAPMVPFGYMCITKWCHYEQGST